MRLIGLVLFGALAGCRLPAPSHALVVRDVASKCALIALSGCAALREPASARRDDAK